LGQLVKDEFRQSVEWSQSVGELVSELDNPCSSVVVNCCCEKLVAEARDSLGTQRKEKVCHLEAATKQQLVKTLNSLRRPSVPYSDL
jgi:hypothetical protein